MLGTWDLGFAPHWQDFDGPTKVRSFAGDAVSRGLAEGAFAVGFPLAVAFFDDPNDVFHGCCVLRWNWLMKAVVKLGEAGSDLPDLEGAD